MSESKWTNIDAKRGPKKSIWIGESKERDDIYPGKDGKPVPSRYGPDRVYVANFLASGKVTEEQAAANASRAVQCVSACEGLADPRAEIERLRASVLDLKERNAAQASTIITLREDAATLAREVEAKREHSTNPSVATLHAVNLAEQDTDESGAIARCKGAT